MYISNTSPNLFLLKKNTLGLSVVTLILSLLFLGLAACSGRGREDIDATNATLAYLENTYGAVHNVELDALLQKISQRLLAAQPGLKTFPEYDWINFRRTAKLPWQTYVIGDMNLNAFAIGSGVLVVTKGMILSLDSEAKLAAVIAHEMSHELLDHTIRAMVIEENQENLQQQYNINQEILADRLSALLLHSAGYPPTASIETLTTVQRIQPQTEEKYFFRRVSALKSKIANIPQDRPYINNTRQFNRARRMLHG